MEDIEFFLVIWLVGAIVGAAISNHKNRSAVVGALTGGLLGLVGILILVCLRKLPDPQQSTLKA